jgi:hypothetical protein
MKYPKVFLFLFMAWIPTMGICQSPMYFSKAYCPENIATNASNIFLVDSGYIFSAAYKDSLNNRQRLLLIQIDHHGTINKEASHGNDTMKYYPSFGGSMIQGKDSFYYWATSKANVVKAMGVLICFDRFFNIVWEQDYEYNNDSSYSHMALLNIIATIDNGFAMVGTQTSSQNVGDLLLQKTDSLGNLLWRKHYVYKGMSMAWSVIQTPDHGYLLGGGAYLPYINQSYQGIIIKTDSLGYEQWRRLTGSSNYNDSWCMVKNSPDGNFIVGTTVGLELMNPEAAFGKVNLIKYYPTGGVLWKKTYGPKKTWNSTTQVYVHPNGDIVASGYYHPGDTTKNIDTFSWILKTNNNGDSIWMREHYRYDGYLSTNSLYDIKPTPDGGYILVGQTDSFGFIPQSAWVLKVDSLGCAVPGCQYVGMKEVIINNEELVVYPNPARDVIHLKIPEFAVANTKELRIFNASGQEVFRQELPPGDPQPTIHINHLPNGSYYLRVITPEISIAWSKVVIISK